jgi:hypothetical protein
MKRLLAGLVAVGALCSYTVSGFATNKPSSPVVRTPIKPGQIVALTKVVCSTSGSPVEFPSGMAITNKGNTVIKTGTKISWGFTKGAKGVHTLDADLAPGKSVFKGGVNPGGLEAGSPCTAKLL